MAGSEVYTYNLTRELAKEEEMFVFTRIENPFEPEYTQISESDREIEILRINKSKRDYTLEDKYLDPQIDSAFRDYVNAIRPDVVHFGHLSHLSTNLVNIAKEEFKLPVIFTIHDFWLHCYRGQLVDLNLKICPGPSDENCFVCARNTFKNVSIEDIKKFRNHMAKVRENIDYFLSPSHYLLNFFEEHEESNGKVKYSKYGFNTSIIEFRKKKFNSKSEITFGFMGRVIPVKGIKILLQSFSNLDQNSSQLLIYGNSENYLKYLRKYASDNVKFEGSFKNEEINSILNKIDVLIVPSLWYENSPLVIQEAFLAGIPVITSNIGGMKELVQHGINGFTFPMGECNSLSKIMQDIIDNPSILNKLQINPKLVRSIEDDAKTVLNLYKKVVNR